MSNFTEWTLAKLERRFKLRLDLSLPALKEWMAADVPLTEQERIFLEFHQKNLTVNVFGWNEQELSLHFIGPVLSLLDFTGTEVNLFAGREFDSVVDGEPIKGKPDGMIATGHFEPELPYFCLQEYKKGVDPNGDPYGQCLVAMLAAQELNQHKFPVFGVVVVGEKWNFMVLQGNKYAYSPGFIALDGDLFRIFSILKALKKKVLKFVRE